jgi:hypothetical protein
MHLIIDTKKVRKSLTLVNRFLLTRSSVQSNIANNTPAKPIHESSNCAGFFMPKIHVTSWKA